jgi:hypothetical protein
VGATRKFLALFVLFICALAGTQAAWACSCADTTVEHRFQDHSVVFIGKALSIAPDLSLRDVPFEAVTFLVQKSWKGVKAGQRVRFHTMVKCCTCGISIQAFASLAAGDAPAPLNQATDYRRKLPKLFQTWLIYAAGREPYSLFLCSGSRPYDAKFNADEVRWLDRHVRAR